ncbi:putative hydro-lyase [Sulfitobacter sp. R86518]|uniref:putative hydro-lyase n=1 Tax=Sulfitobacter sp. R86518 TaxID=3093858 RepID=UPI0036DE052B
MNSQTVSHSDLKSSSAELVRAAIRSGSYQGHTAGLAAGKLQCNLAILPEEFALDFLRFCQRNPKPCPVVGIGDTGNPKLTTLGNDIDICRDVSKYRIFCDGVLGSEVTDISDIWTDDLVSVALGCSFTFENALLRNDIPVRHIEAGRNVPMYRTNVDLTPAGPFAGQMVVTMRPIPEGQVAQAKAISGKFPQAHGSPIAVGDPAQIGIADLSKPDWGDAVEVKAGEVPVYWACGVTPQNVLLDARLPICITHSPGHMLISDIAEDAETTILPRNKINKEN